MRFGVLFAGLFSAAALAGMAGTASAQSAPRSHAPAVSLSDAQNAQNAGQRATPPAPRRGLRWYDTGRWGLNFNLNQPVGRETQWGDVEAGAYYSLTPRLSVGAVGSVARPEQDPARAPESDSRSQPRIRLESIFKF
ncbi:MAG: hypothetical protein EBR82_06645 [Caulobacteraceae bacterium]|nr:hypothetical protein [Caulobacteraceae bacterium]